MIAAPLPKIKKRYVAVAVVAVAAAVEFIAPDAPVAAIRAAILALLGF